MRTYIERTFIKIERLMEKKGYLPSNYFLYNNYDGEFVLKIHSITKVLDERFRAKHLRAALRKAYKFVKEL